jgi:hypothetical protein
MNQQEIDSPRRPIILLDINYTLVANSPSHGTSPKCMEKRLAGEQYRRSLVDLVRPHTVILMTPATSRLRATHGLARSMPATGSHVSGSPKRALACKMRLAS